MPIAHISFQKKEGNEPSIISRECQQYIGGEECWHVLLYVFIFKYQYYL